MRDMTRTSIMRYIELALWDIWLEVALRDRPLYKRTSIIKLLYDRSHTALIESV